MFTVSLEMFACIFWEPNDGATKFACSKLTAETLECRRSGVFIVNFEHISHLVLVFLLLTLKM